MKNYFILIFLACFIAQLSAQDTIIEREDFTLEIKRITEPSKPYQSIKTGLDAETVEFYWINNNLSWIVTKWIEFMELEPIEYEINGLSKHQPNLFTVVDTAQLRKDLEKDDSKIVMSDYLKLSDSTMVFRGYNVKLTNKAEGKRPAKELHREAFEAFAATMGFELKVITEEKTFWMLHTIDFSTATISEDQDKFWKRIEGDNYVQYERISFERIADLLGRKLDGFVRPISYESYKFDIRMPRSDEVADLQYAMMEHGLELIQITEDVEVLVINTNVE